MALTDNLLAYWNLDTNSWLDSSGNNNTLTNVDGVSLGTGIIKGGAYKNSITQFLVNNSFAGFGTGDFSVSVWVNYSASSDYANIVSTRDYDYRGEDCWCIGIHQGELFFWNYEFLLGFHSLATNIWNHIVVTRASGLLKLYINGRLITTGNDSVYDYTRSGIAIGGNTVSTPYTIDGTIDEVGVWGRALSQEEVTSILNTTGAGNLNAGILAYWKMDEESGTRSDATGNLYDLVQYPLAPVGGTFNGLYRINAIQPLSWNNNNETWQFYDVYIIWSITNQQDSHRWNLVYNDNNDIFLQAYNDSEDFRNSTWYDYDNNPISVSYVYNTVNYDANGVINDAVAFNRNGYLSYYNYAEDLPLPINHNNFSVAGWVKLGDNNVTQQTFFSQWNNVNGGISWVVNYTNDGLEPESIGITVHTYSVNKVSITPNIPLNVGEWYHIAFTYDGVNLLLYLNSQLVGSATNSSGIYNSSAPIEIGSVQSGGYKLNGSIDELGIWNRVLTQENIFNLYYRTDGNSYPFSKPVITQNLNDELLAYYPLDENTGTRYDFANGYDLSQNGIVGSEKGIIDNAASFVGTPSNYLYNDSIHTDLPLFSVSFWVNARSFNGGTYPTAVTIGDESSNDTLWFINDNAREGSYIYLYDSYSNVVGTIHPNLTFGTWQHCVITSDAFSVNYYKDGNLVESTPHSVLTGKPLTFAGFKLGGSSVLNSLFDGLLDDVKIWNRSITSDEVLSIYKSGAKTSKYNFQKVLGIPTYTFEKVTPQSILDLPFYIKSGGAGSSKIKIYQDGLYGKRYIGYYPDDGGVNAFGTLPRSTDNYPPHGDEEATVDFYNFSSSPNGSQYDFYSWQWTGYFKAPYTDDFVFRIANVDDAVDLWVGDNAISGFTSQNRTTGGFYNADNSSDPIHMIGGQYYPVRLQFGEASGDDQFILEYSSTYETDVSNFQGRFFHLTDQDFPV